MINIAIDYYVRIDQGDINRLIKALNGIEKDAPKYIARALNKTATTMRKDLINEIQKTYTNKYGATKSQLRIEKASAGKLVARIHVSGDTIQLTAFKHTSGGKRGAAKAQVVKAGALKPVLKNGNKAWKGNDNKIHVRTGEARGPAPAVKGPSVPGMVRGTRVYPQVRERGEEHLHHYMEQQIDMLIASGG